MTIPSRGPVSYVPSIEKRYGMPLSEWLEILASSPLTKHSELVNWLKADYGVGHGHATALVHLFKEASPRPLKMSTGATVVRNHGERRELAVHHKEPRP